MSVWDHPGIVEDLQRHYDAGLSASQIANELGRGITRNAVIGKIHRLGKIRPEAAVKRLREVQTKLAKPPKPAPEPKARAQRTYSTKPPKPTREVHDVYAPLVKPKAKVWEPLEGTTPQAEWQRNGCKWPIGSWERGDRFYCCAPAKLLEDGNRSPYCAGHHAIGFDQTDTRAKRARSFKGALWAARAAA